MQRQNTTRNIGAEKPFNNESSVVVFQGTGITGDETINITGDETISSHVAKNASEKKIAQLIGRRFINIKMKRSDNVRSLATITSTVKIKDKVS